MGGDPLSSRHQGRRPGRVRGLRRERARVRLRRLRGNRCPGQDRGGAIWRSRRNFRPPPAPIFPPRNRNCAWPRSMGRSDLSPSGPARPEQRTPFSEYVRFSKGPALRWLDDKGIPNDVRAEYPRLCPDKFQHGRAAMFEGAPKSWKDTLQAAENSQPQAFPLADQRLHARGQPLLGGGEPERGSHSARLRSPAQE